MKSTLILLGLTLISSTFAHPHKGFQASFPQRSSHTRRQSPTTQRTSAYDYTDDTQTLLVSGNCTNGEIRKVINGWAEAGYLAEALTQWDPSTSDTYNDAIDLYMGNDSTAYQDRLVGNNERAYALHTGPQPSPDTHFWIYCNNPAPKERRKPCGKELFAYVWTDQGTVERNHYMVACPLYFNDTETPTLAQALSSVRDGTTSDTNIESFTNNKGSVMLHESVHWNNTVGQPMIFDYVPPNRTTIYGAENVTKSAVYNNADGNSQVAEAYEIAGAAIFAMEIFGLSEAPAFVGGGDAEEKRKRQNDVDDSDSDSDSDSDGDDEDGEDTVEPPTGFVPPSDPDTPDLGVTVLDWEDDGNEDDQQENVYAWYRISGSLANIDPDDYLPEPISSNATANNRTNSTGPSSSNNGNVGGSTGSTGGSNRQPYSPYGNAPPTSNGQSSYGSARPATGNRVGGSSSNGQQAPSFPSNGRPGGATGPSGSSNGGSTGGNGLSSSSSSTGTSGANGANGGTGSASNNKGTFGSPCPQGYSLRPSGGVRAGNGTQPTLQSYRFR